MVLVHSKGFELNNDLRDEVQEKIELAFGRFEDQIGKVDVHLADLNGPKKGVDKSIRLVINVERQPIIVVEKKGEDWISLLDSISDRAVHCVSRQLDSSRTSKGAMSMAGDSESLSSRNSTESDNKTMQEWNPLSEPQNQS